MKNKAKIYTIDRQSLKALAHSIRAGISPREALLYIASSKKNKQKRDMETIADMFLSGMPYSEVFSHTQLSKNPLFIQIIHISESNGQIAVALEKIVAHLSNANKARSQIIGLSVYPAIVLLMTISFSLFTLLVIVPNIKDIISMPGVSLNPLTSMMLYASDLLIHRSPLVIGTLIGLIVALIVIFRLRFFRMKFHIFILKSPAISSFMKAYLFGSYSAFIALYIRFRADIGTVFGLLANTTKLHPIKLEFIRISESVTKGMQLSDALKGGQMRRAGTEIVPSIWTLFASVAERSSSYGDMFDHLAEHHAEALDHYSKIYMKMLEPVLMIGIGVLVGLLAYGILSPLYGLMQHVK